jgi:flagellar motor switch protein FliN
MLTFNQPRVPQAARIRMASLENVSLDISVVLGKTDMSVHQVLRLGRGAIIELDAADHDEVKILADNFPGPKRTAVRGNRIAIEVKELLLRTPDAR